MMDQHYEDGKETLKSLPRTGTLVIFEKQGEKYLLLLKSKSRNGEWEIPGGEVQRLPSPDDAAREIREETGYEVTPAPLLPEGWDLRPRINSKVGSGEKRSIVPYIFEAEVKVDSFPTIKLTEHENYGFLRLPLKNKDNVFDFYMSLNTGNLSVSNDDDQVTAKNIKLSEFSEMALRRHLNRHYYLNE